jgi:hypothetical protein
MWDQILYAVENIEGVRGPVFGALGALIAIPVTIMVNVLSKLKSIVTPGQIRLMGVGFAVVIGIIIGTSGLDMSHSIQSGMMAGGMIIWANGRK